MCIYALFFELFNVFLRGFAIYPLRRFLAVPADFKLTVQNSLKKDIAKQQAQGKTTYTKLIQNLSQEGNQSGKKWLKSITENVCKIFVEEIRK